MDIARNKSYAAQRGAAEHERGAGHLQGGTSPTSSRAPMFPSSWWDPTSASVAWPRSRNESSSWLPAPGGRSGGTTPPPPRCRTCSGAESL